jgi:hypothetical protein
VVVDRDLHDLPVVEYRQLARKAGELGDGNGWMRDPRGAAGRKRKLPRI